MAITTSDFACDGSVTPGEGHREVEERAVPRPGCTPSLTPRKTALAPAVHAEVKGETQRLPVRRRKSNRCIYTASSPYFASSDKRISWRGCRHGKPLQLLGFCSLLHPRPRAEDTQEEKVDVVHDDWISDDDVYRLSSTCQRHRRRMTMASASNSNEVVDRVVGGVISLPQLKNEGDD
ncbi:hypothetical protein C0Q70_02909 [Pomacea canaliculata]|uniref:Uncharacterized protein n=1 Tax=Pomacea canaliculata TaxID=400727 RepID=A0A2T7PRC4_POMCA|nr:hypothetical protein C0Q70_02909 [Pomacea canaliculata]